MTKTKWGIFSPIAGLYQKLDGIEALRKFFMGPLYPLFVALLTLVGHLFALDVITNLLGMLAVSLAFLVCRTARPFIPFSCMYIFQMSVKYAPGVPTFSDYYMTGWRLPLIIAAYSLFILTLVFFAVRNKIFVGMNFKNTKLFLPLAVLFAALTLSGVFSTSWSLGALGFGALVGVFMFSLFLVFYRGMRTEKRGEIIDYFVYVSLVTLVVLLIQVAYCVTFGGAFSGGEIIKEKMVFGWGIWSYMGYALVVLIPVMFVGAFRSAKYSWGYFAAAVAAFIGAFLTMSRNAWLAGFAALAFCILFSAFVGRHKVAYRIISGVGVLGCAAFLILFRDKVPGLVSALFNDNGRYELWSLGFKNFLSSPIFGTGFFGLHYPEDSVYFLGAGFLPELAHQTFVELLSAGGLFALGAYVYYRVMTFCHVLKRPNAVRVLLFVSALIMPIMSLVENYMFSFWPVIHYTVALAICYLDCDNQNAEKEPQNTVDVPEKTPAE